VGKPGLRNTAHSLFLACYLFPTVSQAAHPLITEDTGTQGKDRFQLELTTEHGYRGEDHAAEHERRFAATFSHGVRDNLDVIFTLPYQRVSPQANGGIETHSGISDVGVDIKWRFLENDTLNMALKPGITFPTGDEAVGLGSGKSAYSLYLVTTIEPEPWALHLHLGYLRHRNVADEREGIWHTSLGGWREVGKKLKIAGDIGANANADKSSDNDTAFLIVGVIYSINPDFDVDVGIRKGLTNPETDYTLLGGVALRF
jgi:hypothetical protein